MTFLERVLGRSSRLAATEPEPAPLAAEVPPPRAITAQKPALIPALILRHRSTLRLSRDDLGREVRQTAEPTPVRADASRSHRFDAVPVERLPSCGGCGKPIKPTDLHHGFNRGRPGGWCRTRSAF